MGAESSRTRHVILDAVERLLLNQGYASVAYRTLAAEAEVTAALVQYYFPTLDDVFAAMIRREREGHIGRLVADLQTRSHEPLRVIWEFSKDEVAGALTMEIMALGNHRKSISAEIAETANRVREIQLGAINSAMGSPRYANSELSPPVLMFLLVGVPKLLTIESNLGVSSCHVEVLEAFERYLDTVEPRAPFPVRHELKKAE